ncbi:MAG: M56 family metallopeptidase [Novosphingobium sp.]|nr:M56 family metallopeptidase [Novosphingobium sp.]
MSTIPILFEIVWKSFLVAGATLLVLRFARDRTAGERSWIAHAGLAVLLALPLAAVALPAWSPKTATIDATGTAAAPIAIPDALSMANPVPEKAVSPEPVPPAALTLPSPETVALWLYLVPLALLAGTMLVAVLRLATLRGRAQIMEDAPWLTALARAQRRMGFKHGTALLVSDELRSPISWGVVRPIILLNSQAIAARGEAEAIIAHELAHVARLDWFKLLISRAATALLWFNPLVWALAREAHQLREEAADDAVLMSQVDGADYAALLVNAARHDNPGLLIAAHGVAPGKDSLKRRVTRVLDASLPRRPASALWTGAGLVVLAGLAAPLAAFDPITVCTWDEAKERARSVVAPSAGFGAIELAAAIAPAGMLPAAATNPAAAVLAAPATHSDRRLSPEELTHMRAVGVTREYIEALEDAGFREFGMTEVTQAKALGVTPEFARAMRAAFPEAGLEEIAQARALGVGPDEARAMRRAYPGADLNELAAAKATGVTAAYAAEMRRYFPTVEMDELTAMRAVGVDAAFVRSMQRSARGPIEPEEAIEARAVGMPRGVAAEVGRATAAARAVAATAAARAGRSHVDVNVDPDIGIDVDVDPDPEE